MSLALKIQMIQTNGEQQKTKILVTLQCLRVEEHALSVEVVDIGMRVISVDSPHGADK